MLWWARILCSALLSASVLVIITLIYLYFTFTSSSFKIKLTPPQRNLSFHKTSYDFKRLLTRFYSLEKEQKNEDFLKEVPQVPPPKLEAIYCGKRKKVALLKFQRESFWVEEKEVIKGWKVEKITPFSVILKFNQIKVTQKLFEKKKKEKTQKSPEKPGYFNQKVFVVSKEELERLTADIGTLFSQIGLRPYFQRGKIEGMKITYIAPDSIFSKAGLRRGDIILTLNDIPIRTTEDSYRIFETLKTAPYIEVKIKRNNNILTLRAEVR